MNKNYLKGLSGKERTKRKKEIERRAEEPHDDPRSYRPFATDKTSGGKERKTKESQWTKKARKMGYGPENETHEVDEGLIEEIIREMVTEELEILEEKKKKRNNVTKALKNKAEKSGAPMGALRAIYNKGLAAWRTGHRPGASQHAWAMARVNSVLAGGPARKVDATQWKQIQKARKKKKKD